MNNNTLDRAYCYDTDSILTVYQVREMHFDETNSFRADNARYECPDPNCQSVVTGVNHSKTRFKRTPHFRLLPKHQHDKRCGFYSEKMGNQNDVDNTI